VKDFRRRCTLLLILYLSISLSIVGEANAISKKCELAEKLYLQGNYTSAAYESERLLQKYKTGDVSNEAACIAGLSHLKLNNLDSSKRFFEFVLNNSDNPLLIDEATIGLANIPKTSPSIKEPSHFSVQVGSFEYKKNADRLYRRFKRRKYTVRITEEKDGKISIYKVKIGRFNKKEDAVQFAKKLRRWGYPTTIVAY